MFLRSKFCAHETLSSERIGPHSHAREVSTGKKFNGPEAQELPTTPPLYHPRIEK